MAESQSHRRYTTTGPSRIDADLTAHHCAGVPMIRRPLGRRPHVCIVGAGVAGLRAADVLLQHGAQVTVYEAKRRVGGRVGQSSHLGPVVDLGPNWIHGTDNNPILDIARATGTAIHSWGERQAYVASDGRLLPDAHVPELAETFWGIIADAFRVSNEQHDAIPADASLLDFIRDQAQTKFLDDAPADAARKRELLLQSADEWGAFVGSPVQRQSLKFFWLEECIEGENPFVAGTYQKVLERVAEAALAGARIEYGTVVQRVVTAPEGGGVVVHAQERAPTQFDEVVVTVPLGCLKEKQLAFEPSLPPRLQQAIDSIGYGCLDKVYITFPAAFWEQTPPTAPPPPPQQTRSASLHTPNVTATTTPLHPSTTAETGTRLPGFVHFLEPRYAPSTNPHRWGQQVINLAALPAHCAHPTLLFYIFGDCAFHIGKLVADRAPDACTQALVDFFEPYFACLPHYDKGNPNCTPTGALATAWANDRYAGHGSYCNFQVGLEQGDKDIECMRHGVPDQRLWLAGEHTAPFVALGTITGAYWAGDGVGKRIVEAYGLH